ncbi:MAG: hypothetical protein LUF25_00795 [Phascolarctobacterium sp.]|nr:hypothetical protein [Phascolarctobacterium sp.]
MAKNLMIVESPTKAKTIGKILNTRKHNVCSECGNLLVEHMERTDRKLLYCIDQNCSKGRLKKGSKK